MAEQSVPTYALYGEEPNQLDEFRIHCESIASRSQLFSWEIKPHRHDHFFQILYLRSGHGDAMFGETVHDIRPRTILSVPPDLVHGFRFSKDMDGLVLTCLATRPPVFDPLAKALPPGLSQARIFYHDPEWQDWPFLVANLERIETELAAGFASGTGLVDSCLTTALTLLSRHTGESASTTDLADRDLTRINQLNDLIGLHFRKHHPVSFYADKIGISENHLNRITRAALNSTVNRLILNKLMDEAKRDLVFTSMTIQQITFDLGYTDPAYFSRLFSQQCGQSPKDYRMEKRHKLKP